MTALAFSRNDTVTKAIRSWVGERPVPSDVMEQEALLLGIQLEIGNSKLPRHLEILEQVRHARAMIGKEVEARTDAGDISMLMGHCSITEIMDIHEAGQDAGC